MTFQAHKTTLMSALEVFPHMPQAVSESAMSELLFHCQQDCMLKFPATSHTAQHCSASSNEKNVTTFSEDNNYGLMQNIVGGSHREEKKAALLLHQILSHEMSAKATLKI